MTAPQSQKTPPITIRELLIYQAGFAALIAAGWNVYAEHHQRISDAVISTIAMFWLLFLPYVLFVPGTYLIRIVLESFCKWRRLRNSIALAPILLFTLFYPAMVAFETADFSPRQLWWSGLGVGFATITLLYRMWLFLLTVGDSPLEELEPQDSDTN